MLSSIHRLLPHSETITFSPTVALSSTEAEYMEFRDTAKQCAWLRTFQSELGYKVDQPTPLCSDNQGAIFIALQPVFSRRTKHINIMFHYIKEYIEDNQAYLYYINTDDMVADALTKALALEAHDRHRLNFGLQG